MDRSRLDNLIARNREHAERFGWSPSDWGADDFDALLVERVRQFQRRRWIRATGLVNDETLIALQSYRQALADSAETDDHDANLLGLGSTGRLKPDDPAVVRSEVFAGRAWYVDPEDAGLDLDPALDLVDLVVLPLSLADRFQSDASARRVGWATGDLGSPTRSGREIGARFADSDLTGVVVEFGLGDLEALHSRASRMLAFVEALDAIDNRPRAVVLDIARHISAPGWRNLHTCARFDAALPPVPGRLGRRPAEYVIGWIVSCWSVYAKVKPTFCFPAIDPIETTTPNEVHRFRAWARDRSIRGLGWRGGLSELARAFIEPLPAEIPRIDKF